jgi:hypothetical protein
VGAETSLDEEKERCGPQDTKLVSLQVNPLSFTRTKVITIFDHNQQV